MSVNIKGMGKLLKDLEIRLGKEKIQRITDQALQEGAEVFIKELKQEFEQFKDTGGSIEEMTFFPPSTENGVRTIRIRWRGPKNRYRIIHLNEFGTITNPNPAGKGAIARAMRNAEKPYRQVIKRILKEGMR
ncbi:hypothetical protein FZC76_16135 [Sutcliffiella horikoshii]|uniref:HK97 gp10 family phage protein n=1 Tax=Sutcliffiella horikoshii TaxID=79883 RepID=A0A5D4SYG8_9BACI|nr:hypothetical protein [Sutcliffiella horikoshii]TYS67054.1 hypothetical protein FZC76_16135 [Sutcliffiella horikoshii]